MTFVQVNQEGILETKQQLMTEKRKKKKEYIILTLNIKANIPYLQQFHYQTQSEFNNNHVTGSFIIRINSHTKLMVLNYKNWKLV